MKLVLLLSLFISFCSAGKTITVCHEDQPYPPHVYPSQGDDKLPKGILIDIITQASQEAGFTVKFIKRPWLRCQKMVQANQAQSLFAMLKTPARTKKFRFPDNNNYKLLSGNYTVFIKNNGTIDRSIMVKQLRTARGQLNIGNYKKIKQYGLSAPVGYIAHDLLTRAGIISQLDYTLSSGMKSVKRGKLDGFVIEELIGDYHIKTHDLQGSVYNSQLSLLSADWFMPFNKHFYRNNRQKVEQFWRSLPAIRAKVIQAYNER